MKARIHFNNFYDGQAELANVRHFQQAQRTNTQRPFPKSFFNQLHRYLFFFLLPFSLCACSQDSTKAAGKVQRHHYSFGDKKLSVKEASYTTGIPIQFLQLHSNEETAGKVTAKISEEMGIDFLQIENNSQRLIEFELKKAEYRFDPNRIFSTEGIVTTLQRLSSYSEEAFQAVFYFREFLLGLVDRNKIIVAVHNNTDGNFSLADYRENETGLVHQNPALDPDDFIITTDSVIYSQIKDANFNVVLEYRDALTDDGSLSIYSSRNNLLYVNVEAQHGHAKEQEEMLRSLVSILYRPKDSQSKKQ